MTPASGKEYQGEKIGQPEIAQACQARTPALGLGLVDASTERRGVDEPVGRIGSRAGLANDELVEVNAVGRDLEHGRAGEGTAGRVQETLAVVVEALVVELHVVL